MPTKVGIYQSEEPGAGRCQPWLATLLQSHHPHAETTALDLAGFQLGHGLVGLLTRDCHVGAGREDRDLADELARQAGITGQRTEDVARAQLVGLATVDPQRAHRGLRQFGRA